MNLYHVDIKRTSRTTGKVINRCELAVATDVGAAASAVKAKWNEDEKFEVIGVNRMEKDVVVAA